MQRRPTGSGDCSSGRLWPPKRSVARPEGCHGDVSTSTHAATDPSTRNIAQRTSAMWKSVVGFEASGVQQPVLCAEDALSEWCASTADRMVGWGGGGRWCGRRTDAVVLGVCPVVLGTNSAPAA
eukprot:ctg_586.g303